MKDWRKFLNVKIEENISGISLQTNLWLHCKSYNIDYYTDFVSIVLDAKLENELVVDDIEKNIVDHIIVILNKNDNRHNDKNLMIILAFMI